MTNRKLSIYVLIKNVNLHLKLVLFIINYLGCADCFLENHVC